MRWQQLFADLAAQFDAAEREAEWGELASRTRAEVGAVRLVDRVRAALGAPVTLRCRGAGLVGGVLTEVGVDWLLLSEQDDREALVASRAVQSVTGLSQVTAAPETGAVALRLDFRWAVRGIARDRSAVRVVLDDGSLLAGTIDRVGADFLELAEHPPGEPRRAGAVRRVSAVALEAVAVVRTSPPGGG